MGMIYSPSVAGSTGQVQFNDSGVIGSDSSFFWNNTNKRLGLNTVLPSAQLDISSSLALQVPLTIRGASGQSANLFELRNSSGVILNNIDSNGNFKIINNSNPNIKLSATTANNINGRITWGAENIANDSIRLLAIDLGYNSVANLAIDVSSNPINGISSSDRNVLFASNGTTFYKGVSFSGFNSINIGDGNNNGGWYIGNSVATAKVATLFRAYGYFGIGDLGLAVRTVLDNLPVTVSEIRLNVSGTNGCVGIGIGTTTPSAQLHIQSSTTSTVTNVLQQIASQSVAILEARDSAGNSKASITKDFELQTTTGSGAPTTTPVNGATYVDTTNHRFYVRSGGTWKYTNLI